MESRKVALCKETVSPGKRFAVGVASASLVAALAIGGALAYLTDSASIQNQFTLDTNLSIALEEANFDAEMASGLLPTQEVSKDPKVINNGTVDAYIAATVKLPVMDGKVLDKEGKIQEVTAFDLYSFDLGEGWVSYGEASVQDGFKTYTYLYSGFLAGGNETGPIFNKFEVANFIDDPGLENVNIDIEAYAIQSHGFDSAADAYEAYKMQNVVAAVSA